MLAIDNASSDDSVALLHGFSVIRNDTNRGFAAAVNQVFEVARGEFVLLLNPDVFLEPDYVRETVRALTAAGEAFGSATGKLLRAEGFDIRPTNRIDSLGIRMTRSGRHLDLMQDQPDDPSLREPFEVFGVSGAAALYRMTFWRDATVGYQVFDEDFFAYREDADLSWRGQLFGWRALAVPSAVGYHVRRVTPEVRRELPPEINMHSVKNRFLLRLKNEGLYLALRNAPFEIARDVVVLIAALTIERSSLPAFEWLWRNRARILRTRRIVQSRRKVGDRELARWFR
jgi:GT2 family glycosyltransferase